jgi:heavy metal translocating P-type ATPase
MRSPYLFDEFFSSGREESISPFLTKSSKPWGKYLVLKSAFAGAIFLALAFGFSFINPPLSSFCLALVFFLAGTPALIDAIDDIKNLQINIDVLMTLAAFLALMIDSGMEGGLLLVLFEISGALETTVSNKALSALHNLNNLAPKFAHRVSEDGTVYDKAVREIEKGMKLFVKVGEIVPLDGKVIEGTTSVNLVHLTGESIPALIAVGDEIPAGARNLDAGIVIEVTRTSSDSTLTRIIQLIIEAQEAKPRLASFLDDFGRIYASSIIALTFLFAISFPFLFSISFLGTEGSLYRALAFLIAASPCALIIAIPTAYLSAISSSAKKGILLKGGITLDALASCTMVAFDKTGTLTTGDLVCVGLEAIGPSSYSKEEALGIAASLERHVVHPIANAIVRFALEQKAPTYDIAKFQSIPGYGLEGFVLNEVPVAIGLLEHIEKRVPQALLEKLRVSTAKESGGQLLAALSIGSSLFLFRFTDQVRKEVPLLMKKLSQEHNLRSVMLTGDNEKNAHHVGKLLGITEVFANLRPEDKLAKVASLSESGGLAMIGDGINDAPALARATVGISMGRIGSATAVDASDVVLLNDDLHLLGWLFSKARLTRRIVKQNLVLALAVILFATTPALLGWVPLWMAVILHEGGTVLVGLNSLRLLRK